MKNLKFLFTFVSAIILISSVATVFAKSNVIRIAHSEYAFTYDPIFCGWSDVGRICKVAYDGLLKYEPNNKVVVPHLARSYVKLDSGMRYRFVLNKNVKFHNGNIMTSSDVKYSFDRLLTLNDGVGQLISDVKLINIIDDHTFDIVLKRPTTGFVYMLPQIMIINSKEAKKNEINGDWAQKYLEDHDLGSGPYQLSLHLAEQRSEFVKFDEYWKGWRKGSIDGVVFLWIKDSSTQRLMIEKGDLDIMMEPVMIELEELKKNDDLKILSDSSAVVFSIDLRVIRKPLDDINVRKALAHAIDYDYHLNVALAGYGKRAKGPLGSQLKYFNDELKLVEFNMNKAKEYLKKAGYPNGGFNLKLVYQSAHFELQRALEMIQQNWGMLGIKVEPVNTDWMGQYEMQKNKDADVDVFLGYLWPNAAETDVALRPYFHTDFKGTYGENASYWSNVKVDNLLDAGLVEQDVSKREIYYKKAQAEIVKHQPSIFVSESPYVIVANKKVNGYEYNPAHHQVVDVYNMTLSSK